MFGNEIKKNFKKNNSVVIGTFVTANGPSQLSTALEEQQSC
jgi:hypothetical protein